MGRLQRSTEISEACLPGVRDRSFSRYVCNSALPVALGGQGLLSACWNRWIYNATTWSGGGC